MIRSGTDFTITSTWSRSTADDLPQTWFSRRPKTFPAPKTFCILRATSTGLPRPQLVPVSRPSSGIGHKPLQTCSKAVNETNVKIQSRIFTGMWVSRPGLGLETDQDHFFEVLVLVSTLLVLVLVLVSACLGLVSVSACLVSVSACLVLVLVSVSACLVLVWS